MLVEEVNTSHIAVVAVNEMRLLHLNADTSTSSLHIAEWVQCVKVGAKSHDALVIPSH